MTALGSFDNRQRLDTKTNDYLKTMATLYLQMTDKLIAHWKGNGNAYPKKFVLSPALRDEYVRCLNLMTIPGDRDMSATKHMGVPIEIDEASPGVMVAADGAEVALQ